MENRERPVIDGVHARHLLLIWLCVMFVSPVASAQLNTTAPPITLDVNSIGWTLNKTRGDGGMVNEYSWNFATGGPDFDFYWPSDEYLSNMLYQIFSPIMLSDSGLVDTAGVRHAKFVEPMQPISMATTDWTWERRRYRPPNVIVDGVKLNPQYNWQVDKTLPADEIAEFSDLIPSYGMRAHVTLYAFSNPELSNVIIWKVTLRFTGEVALPKTNISTRLPDQTISMWWPFSICFGPTMGGFQHVYGLYPFESENVLDNWMKMKSRLVTDDPRDSLYIAYYWAYYLSGLMGAPTYPNGSQDASFDPDRTTGHIYSPQVPGYALLYAPVSAQNSADETSQPYSMMHASIALNLWRSGQDFRNIYVGTENPNKFPPDPITAGLGLQKGPMRFISVGPYNLTKDAATGRYDSVTFVYAIASGSTPYEVADSIGKSWYRGQISDAQKDSLLLTTGKDSLMNSIDRAYWAWDQISHGRPIPSAPPPPDVNVESGSYSVAVNWSYPDPSYFNDAVTGVDDWYAWRVYRKQGAEFVDDASENGANAGWQLVFETRDKGQTTFEDTNVVKGGKYYYAVTAVNNGTQNNGILPGTRLESSRYVTRTTSPAGPMQSTVQNKTIVGYYYFWDKGTFPYTKMEYYVNCIAHAFIVPNADGSISPEPGATWQNFLYSEMLNEAHHLGVKVVVSVGGYGDGKGYGFPKLAADSIARAKFAGNMKDFCLQNGYDGVDIDWEYPGSSDRANFVKLMEVLRDSLSSVTPRLSLSMTAPGYLASGYDFQTLARLVDWVGVMTYDYYGSWTANSGFVSPLYTDPRNDQGSVNSSMTQFIQSGTVPLSKLFMGLAFYGYNFQSSGLYQPRTGNAPSVSYSAAVDSENSGWTYHWDDVSKCPYLTNPANTDIIAFDDTLSIADKCNYLLNKNLGGLIIWRLGLDNMGTSQPLLETTWKCLNTSSSIVYHNSGGEPVHDFGLQNYPNPFNPTTAISYELSANSQVTLRIYDVLGRKVATLVNGRQVAGNHTVEFDARRLASGIYISVLSINGKLSVNKMLYLK